MPEAEHDALCDCVDWPLSGGLMHAPGCPADQVCTCRIVGMSRDPYEPHIPAQPEWEQADDCPVHPRQAGSDDA